MNIEVEIKIKVKDFDVIKKNLKKVGKLKKKIRQIDEYYVPSHRDFNAQKPPREWLRIRSNPGETIFEYDRSVNRQASGLQDYAEEYETVVSRPDELKRILHFLDFTHVCTVNKLREYWDCGEFEVVLDTIRGLGKFIEVEMKAKRTDPIAARHECIEFTRTIGVNASEKALIKHGYPELMLNVRN